MQKKSNRGRKKEADPKDLVTLLVRRSMIIGKANLNMVIKDEEGNWNPDYQEKLEALKKILYDTIEFTQKE